MREYMSRKQALEEGKRIATAEGIEAPKGWISKLVLARHDNNPAALKYFYFIIDRKYQTKEGKERIVFLWDRESFHPSLMKALKMDPPPPKKERKKKRDLSQEPLQQPQFP